MVLFTNVLLYPPSWIFRCVEQSNR